MKNAPDDRASTIANRADRACRSTARRLRRAVRTVLRRRRRAEGPDQPGRGRRPDHRPAQPPVPRPRRPDRRAELPAGASATDAWRAKWSSAPTRPAARRPRYGWPPQRRAAAVRVHGTLHLVGLRRRHGPAERAGCRRRRAGSAGTTAGVAASSGSARAGGPRSSTLHVSGVRDCAVAFGWPRRA